MASLELLSADRVHTILDGRENTELRFRSAVITSTALHTGLTIAMLLAPLFIPTTRLIEFTPVHLVNLSPQPTPTPTPAPPPEPEVEEVADEPEPAPEPEEIEPPPPDDVPEDLEAQRRREEEEEARRREEERLRQEELDRQRQAAEDAARRRREAEEAERRRLEEEEAARRAPQKAARREEPAPEPQQITQQAARGEVGLSLSNESGAVSERDATLLQYWLNRVIANIVNNWDPPSRPPGSREVLAVVHIRVDRSGRIIVDPDVRSSSGNRRYDDAAVRAILGGLPFPPLPQAYRGNTLGLNLGFRQQ